MGVMVNGTCTRYGNSTGYSNGTGYGNGPWSAFLVGKRGFLGIPTAFESRLGDFMSKEQMIEAPAGIIGSGTNRTF
jgi:hypothetical protein